MGKGEPGREGSSEGGISQSNQKKKKKKILYQITFYPFNIVLTTFSEWVLPFLKNRACEMA